MAVVLRNVNDGGEVIERFAGLVHVTDTCASSLNSVIDNFFAKYNLSMSKVTVTFGSRGHVTKYASVNSFFDYHTKIVNIVGVSCKRKDLIRQKQHDDFVKRIETGEVCTRKGKNQEMSLSRTGDTRWGSHLKTILQLLDLWKPVREVLISLSREGTDAKTRGNALGMAEKMENFEFVFIAHLMVNLLRKTNDLLKALQLKN
ncbi:uncharacterized protein LOC143574881 [Bidens hawaiensis]|uniref:uncharacterized protein LOC143574881 n=1 Tax=Bidens hawaiensis TaxID=980011 RepID=UPI00404937E5